MRYATKLQRNCEHPDEVQSMVVNHSGAITIAVDTSVFPKMKTSICNVCWLYFIGIVVIIDSIRCTQS